MLFFRISGFLKYFLFSRHRKGHGIQSPFVFSLVIGAFRNKPGKDIVSRIEGIRRECLSSDKIVSVLDLGAGSVNIKGNIRKVSEIARFTAIPKKYGMLLWSIASEYGNPAIFELGTSLGISTLYLASGATESQIYTIEACPDISAFALHNFSEAGMKNIFLLNGPFDEMLRELQERNIRPGLVFIDGDHRKESVIRYFSMISVMSGKDLVVILDDIHLSPEMEEAWNMIKEFDGVSFTVDIFRMGLAFFRKGMNHSDYVVRY